MRCRFCMHAHHKSRVDSYAGGETNAYCPLDLFSGEEGRIRKSLGGLWDTWVGSDGAVNNLKIFVRGKSVKPQSVSVGVGVELWRFLIWVGRILILISWRRF